MNLNLGFLALVAFVVACSSSTIVEPPPPCSSLAPSGGFTVACTPPVTTSPVGLWAGTLTTEGNSGTQAFTAVIELEADGGDFTGVFTVGDKTFNVSGYSYTYDSGEVQLTFQSPGGELAPQVSPALYTGLTWSGPLAETTFSGTWTQAEESNVIASGTFALERQP